MEYGLKGNRHVLDMAFPLKEREHWISGIGGMLGILAVMATTQCWHSGTGMLVATSLGSTAVLLFAMPHGVVSQPWPVLGGHLSSAIIGVTCARYLGQEPILAASLAVGAAIVVMYLLQCLHPSGGATALFAVTGGDPVLQLGYAYAYGPVFIGSSVLLLVALIYNYPFTWRRYPQAWHAGQHSAVIPKNATTNTSSEKCMIPHSTLVYALSQLDTFVDVSEEDLQRIYALAVADVQTQITHASTVPLPSRTHTD